MKRLNIFAIGLIGLPLIYMVIDVFIIGNVSSPHIGKNALGIDFILLIVGILSYIIIRNYKFE